MEPFYFQARPGGRWHIAVAILPGKYVEARCGFKVSYDRRNRLYKDTETAPYVGGWCTRCK